MLGSEPSGFVLCVCFKLYRISIFKTLCFRMTDFCVQAISHIPASSEEKIDIQEIIFSFRAPGAVPSVPVCISIRPGLRFLCLAAQLSRQKL